MSKFIDPFFGLGALPQNVSPELGVNLQALLFKSPDPRDALLQAIPLYYQILLLLDQLLPEFQDHRSRAEPLFRQLFAHLDAIAYERCGPFQLLDRSLIRRLLRPAACDVTIDRGDLGPLLCDHGSQECALCLRQCGINVCGGTESSGRVGLKCRAQTREFGLGRRKARFETFAVCLRDCLVQHYQYVPLFYGLAVGDPQLADHAQFHRLDDFRAPGGQEFALRDRNDIELANTCPEQGDGEKRHDRPSDRPSSRRGRGFHDFQGGGQELNLVERAIGPQGCAFFQRERL